MWRCWVVAIYPFVSCGIVLVSFLGLIVFRSSNRCDMTYMWMYPEFIDVPLSKQAQERYPQYKLYLYGEGYYAQHIRSLKLNGIPVLFIPGNAGSAKQVRSLASVSLNKTENDYAKHSRFVEFNYFSVDFNEEYSGIYGHYLWKHTDFVHFCIPAIFSLYQQAKNPPTQIVLIGHSMGGLIARAVFTAQKFNSSQISVLITLATPHAPPIMKFDPSVISFAYYLRVWWETHANESLAHLAAISIGGGPNDILVPSHFTLWPTRFASAVQDWGPVRKSKLQLFERITTSIDWVWATTDHLCIVWCNQLVVSIVRSLFDMVPDRGSQITENPYLRREALSFHLLRNVGSKSLRKSPTLRDPIANFGTIKEFRYFSTTKSAQLYRTSPRSLPAILYKLFISEDLVGNSVFLLTTQKVDAVGYFCSEERGCAEGRAVPGHTLAPPSSRLLHMKLERSMVGRTLVAPTFFHSPKKLLVFALYNATDKNHQIVSLNLLSSVVPFWKRTLKIDGSLGFLNLTLEGMESLFQVYTVALMANKCIGYKQDQMAAVYFDVPGSPAQSQFRHFRYPYNCSDDLWLRLQIPDSVTDSWPVLHLLLKPGCEYTLEIGSSVFQSFGQVLRHFGYYLPGMCTFQLLLVLFLSDWNKFSASHEPKWEFAVYHSCIAGYQYFICLLSNIPGLDWFLAAVLNLICVGIVTLGYFLALTVLWMVLGCKTITNHRLWKKKTGKEAKKPEGANDGLEENGVHKRREESKNPEESERTFTPAMIRVSLMLFYLMIPFRLCGGVVVGLILLHHLNTLWNDLNVAEGARALWKGRIRRDAVVFEMHLYALILCVPSLIVWTKGVVSGAFVALNPDGSLFPAVFFSLTLCLPLPVKLVRFRHLTLIPAAVYVYYVDNYIPGLAQCLTAVTGFYLNGSLKTKTGHKSEQKEKESRKQR